MNYLKTFIKTATNINGDISSGGVKDTSERKSSEKIKTATELVPLLEVFEIIKPNFVVIGQNMWRVDIMYEPDDDNGKFRRLGEARLESQTGNEQVWVMPIPEPSVSAQVIMARGHGWRNQKIVTRTLPYEGASKIFKAIEQEQTARFITMTAHQAEFVDRLQVRLVRMVEDNRCPVGIVCEEGILRAEFELSVGTDTETVILGTGNRDYFFAGFTVKIVGVEPPRERSKDLELDEYKIDLYVYKTGK